MKLSSHVTYDHAAYRHRASRCSPSIDIRNGRSDGGGSGGRGRDSNGPPSSLATRDGADTSAPQADQRRTLIWVFSCAVPGNTKTGPWGERRARVNC